MTNKDHYANVVNMEKFRSDNELKAFKGSHSAIAWFTKVGNGVRVVNAFYGLVLKRFLTYFV